MIQNIDKVVLVKMATAGRYINIAKLKSAHSDDNPIKIDCYHDGMYEVAPAPTPKLQEEARKMYSMGYYCERVTYKVTPQFLLERSNFNS